MLFRRIALVFGRCIGGMRTPYRRLVDHDILLLIFIVETVSIVIMPGLFIWRKKPKLCRQRRAMTHILDKTSRLRPAIRYDAQCEAAHPLEVVGESGMPCTVPAALSCVLSIGLDIHFIQTVPGGQGSGHQVVICFLREA